MVLVVVLGCLAKKALRKFFLLWIYCIALNQPAVILIGQATHSATRETISKGQTQMKSYTLEMADGSGLSEGFFETDIDAITWAVSVLEHRGCDAAELVTGDWETRSPDSVRKLFWANDRTADDDTGANAIAHLVKTVKPGSFSVQWEFMGSATQEHFDAAQAVADAMEILGTIEPTKDVLAKACQILNMDLGGDWDSKSVLAMIENCSFERIDQEASADA